MATSGDGDTGVSLTTSMVSPFLCPYLRLSCVRIEPKPPTVTFSFIGLTRQSTRPQHALAVDRIDVEAACVSVSLWRVIVPCLFIEHGDLRVPVTRLRRYGRALVGALAITEVEHLSALAHIRVVFARDQGHHLRAGAPDFGLLEHSGGSFSRTSRRTSLRLPRATVPWSGRVT